MDNRAKAPTWYWIFLGIMLLWNLMGVMSFIQHITLTEEDIAAMPETVQKLYDYYPTWTVVAFGTATIGGFIGCLGLLMRQRWSKMVLILSFIGIVIQMFHMLVYTPTLEVMGPGGAIMPVMIIILGASLIWIATIAQRNKWIV